MRRLLLILAALLAFAGQSFIAQTHIHPAPAGPAMAKIAGESGRTRLSERRSGQDTPDTCPICREYVHAGHYLPPAPIAIEPTIAVAVWVFVAPFVVWRVSRRSHAWRSRGPPRAVPA